MLKSKDCKLSIPVIIKPPDSDYAESEKFSLSNILDSPKMSKQINRSAESARHVIALRKNASITDHALSDIVLADSDRDHDKGHDQH